tara:strand:+ start:351 stop:944 length:594 start_codon:yes stop_codon:yes gene_type:complete
MSLILKNFLQNEKALKKYLTRFFSRPQDIDDVAQETFLKAFASEAKSEIRTPKSFLFKVAKHTALNEIARKANSTTEYIEDSANSNVLEDEAQVGAEQEFDSKQKLIVFSKAVASLSPNCRRVFLLRKMDGLKVKEIARKLDISVSGVEKHIATGLVKCSQYFREQGYDPSEFGEITAPRNTNNDVTLSKLLRVRDE